MEVSISGLNQEIASVALSFGCDLESPSIARSLTIICMGPYPSTITILLVGFFYFFFEERDLHLLALLAYLVLVFL